MEPIAFLLFFMLCFIQMYLAVLVVLCCHFDFLQLFVRPIMIVVFFDFVKLSSKLVSLVWLKDSSF
jgi:hypothetical protein